MRAQRVTSIMVTDVNAAGGTVFVERQFDVFVDISDEGWTRAMELGIDLFDAVKKEVEQTQAIAETVAKVGETFSWSVVASDGTPVKSG